VNLVRRPQGSKRQPRPWHLRHHPPQRQRLLASGSNDQFLFFLNASALYAGVGLGGAIDGITLALVSRASSGKNLTSRYCEFRRPRPGTREGMNADSGTPAPDGSGKWDDLTLPNTRELSSLKIF
jgi:hypothetical protein